MVVFYEIPLILIGVALLALIAGAMYIFSNIVHWVFMISAILSPLIGLCVLVWTIRSSRKKAIRFFWLFGFVCFLIMGCSAPFFCSVFGMTQPDRNIAELYAFIALYVVHAILVTMCALIGKKCNIVDSERKIRYKFPYALISVVLAVVVCFSGYFPLHSWAYECYNSENAQYEDQEAAEEYLALSETLGYARYPFTTSNSYSSGWWPFHLEELRLPIKVFPAGTHFYTTGRKASAGYYTKNGQEKGSYLTEIDGEEVYVWRDGFDYVETESYIEVISFDGERAYVLADDVEPA